jgi:hypothetical protein
MFFSVLFFKRTREVTIADRKLILKGITRDSAEHIKRFKLPSRVVSLTHSYLNTEGQPFFNDR